MNVLVFIILGVCTNFILVVAYAYFYRLLVSVDKDIDFKSVEVLNEPYKDEPKEPLKRYSTEKIKDDEKEAVFEWEINNI